MLGNTQAVMLAANSSSGGGGLTTYTARSFTVDMPDNQGGVTFIGVRSIDLYLNDTLLEITSSGKDFGGTSFFSTSSFEKAFISSYLKTGLFSEGWASLAGVTTNQRIWMWSDSDLVFNRAVVNNFHNSGASTEEGANNVKIHISQNTAKPGDAFEALVPDWVKIYDGLFLEHVALDQADPQELILIP